MLRGLGLADVLQETDEQPDLHEPSSDAGGDALFPPVDRVTSVYGVPEYPGLRRSTDPGDLIAGPELPPTYGGLASASYHQPKHQNGLLHARRTPHLPVIKALSIKSIECLTYCRRDTDCRKRTWTARRARAVLESATRVLTQSM